jgi:hypothetical protein
VVEFLLYAEERPESGLREVSVLVVLKVAMKGTRMG